ncbi:3-deoxy-manno-octulosonate cytidylyltransferase [Streptomyces sp. NPDC001793]|uniref:3-deoxy-manno-octulosonate cytidylyltransferase n=1 Tax=Streptomyces sp. NPDC001793 TaxID=3154657 RepID=UPI00332DDF45
MTSRAAAPTVLGVIPARYAATRLPGKVLRDIAGRPMIEHVWRRAMRATCLDRVLIATDDERVREVCLSFGAETITTSPAHTGTDRVAEAATGTDAGIVVNVQGDEPLLNPDWIDQLVAPLQADPGLPMATLATPLTDPHAVQDPNVVKVVTDLGGNAMYFSRHPIPYQRHHTGITHLQHIGLYAYRAPFLTHFARTAPTPLEEAEGLEQLRALQHGHRIRVVTVTGDSGIGVDTQADLERVRRLFAAPRPS